MAPDSLGYPDSPVYSDSLTHTLVDSPIGPLTLVATSAGLSGVYLAEHRHGPDPSQLGTRDDTGFGPASAQLAEYFRGERSRFDLPLSPRGTPFQRRVWELLATIPYGRTWTYRQLAEAAGKPTAVRAVASANARNPLSIVVPCHRVVGSDGSLTGYAGGLARKRFLLDLEGSAT